MGLMVSSCQILLFHASIIHVKPEDRVDSCGPFCLTTAISFCFSVTERPLHHSEKILEQVLEWSVLDCPSSAFLVIKKFAGAKRESDAKGKLCSQ